MNAVEHGVAQSTHGVTQSNTKLRVTPCRIDSVKLRVTCIKKLSDVDFLIEINILNRVEQFHAVFH